uniref:ATP synthase complex subunit 8 n=2 Tax=Melanitis TaxID=127352 RepID=A0A067YCU9_9NEOP|nr:ATP synthase F0 subunit 8 [Melanitis leda]YP_009045354.1 ATP synthase F0 subunit 8 [Melanitis phedima]AEH05129.1 ATP synthase F0 subunit 8 [Melanitis leda]AHA03705.1 ATP synthase F0 subunit 8 [Melanitis phedima]
MPQMMPINWMLSLFFFIMIFILFNIMNYYIFNYTQSNSTKMIMKKNFLLWKW